MPRHRTQYGPQFYDRIRSGVQSSARALVPYLIAAASPPDEVHIIEDYAGHIVGTVSAAPSRPRTLVDVGCGEGWWAFEFARSDWEVLGIDGPGAVHHYCPFVEWDLAEGPWPPTPFAERADLVLCLEVAEHLPQQRAAGLVTWLCGLGRMVAFSAAVPGQGGTGHVNERWPGYWRDLFAAHGYQGSGALRWQVWGDDRIEWWYRQNLLVFGPDVTPDGCHPVVHPGMWRHHTGNR